MSYTETEFEKLIKSVETEFSAHLAEVEKNFKLEVETSPAEPESLAKAEDGAKKPEPKKEEGKEKPAAEAKPEGEKPEGEAKEAPPAAEAKPAPATGEAASAPEAAPLEAEGHDYDEEDLKHLQQMYMSMSKAELMAHHDACRAALDSKGMEKCGDMSAAAPAAPIQKGEITSHNEASGGQISKETAPHSAPGAKSPASKVEGVQMEKSEKTEVELAKAETAAANAKAETLQKNLDAVSAFLTKLVEKKAAPAGKAITSMDVIAKSEGSNETAPISKQEVDAILNKKTQEGKLEKSDRELINAYYLNGASINSISHLLK